MVVAAVPLTPTLDLSTVMVDRYPNAASAVPQQSNTTHPKSSTLSPRQRFFIRMLILVTDRRRGGTLPRTRARSSLRTAKLAIA